MVGCACKWRVCLGTAVLAGGFLSLSFGFGSAQSTPVSAHSDGATVEQAVGDYLIDVGYEPEEPRGGDQVVLDFSLYSNGAPAQYQKIWVKVSKDGQTYLATSVHRASLGKTTLSLVFPESGEYQLFTRFEDEDSALAEYEFPLEVGEARFANNEEGPMRTMNSQALPLQLVGLVFLAGLVLGVGSMYVVVHKQPRK